MNIRYWEEQLDEQTVLSFTDDELTAHKDLNVDPVECFKVVRDTMEVFGYRTAMTYTDEDKPSLYYFTTLKGIACYEVGSRDNKVERLSIPREESRLYG
jgi:hypothetical protein